MFVCMYVCMYTLCIYVHIYLSELAVGQLDMSRELRPRHGVAEGLHLLGSSGLEGSEMQFWCKMPEAVKAYHTRYYNIIWQTKDSMVFYIVLIILKTLYHFMLMGPNSGSHDFPTSDRSFWAAGRRTRSVGSGPSELPDLRRGGRIAGQIMQTRYCNILYSAIQYHTIPYYATLYAVQTMQRCPTRHQRAGPVG